MNSIASNGARLRLGPTSSALLLLAIFLMVGVSSAEAAKTHLPLGTFGSAAQPSFQKLDGIAVDPATGNLLVIDSQAGTVSRYKPDGSPANFSALGSNVIDGKGIGDLTPQDGFIFGQAGSGEQQVAVDASGSITDGNIYITQPEESAGNLIDVFGSGGEYLGQLTGAGGTKFGSAGSFPFSPCGVATDSNGNLFVGAGYENKVYKYDPSANLPLNGDLVGSYSGSSPICNLAAGSGATAGSLFANTFVTLKGDSILKLSSANLAFQGVVDHGEYRLLSIDPTDGHLYAVVSQVGTVKEFDATGSSANLLSTFGGGTPGGIAINGAAGRIYQGGGQNGTVQVFGPLVTIPEVTTGSAIISGDTSAVLHGTVNPDGTPLEECSFEYGLTTTYGQTVPCKETVGEIGTASAEVHADVNGLTPEALYHYRLVARNVNDVVQGADKTFKAPSKPGIIGLWSTEVGYREGTLKALINPENSPTTYRFEWGVDSSYGQSTAEIPAGSDNTSHVVSMTLNNLNPGITYHYRLIATNGIGISESPDHEFTAYPLSSSPKPACINQAFRTGPSARLPECRAYEMVSPVDKNGGELRAPVTVLNFPARLERSSTNGERFTYSSVTAFANPASAPWSSQYLADRGASGWLTQPISPRREPIGLSESTFKFDTAFKVFTPDLSDGWLLHDTEPPLASCAPAGFINLYRRSNLSGEYEALVPVAPLDVSVDGYGLELQGISGDGRHTIFRANAKLTADAAPAGGFTQYQLYEHVRGEEGCGNIRLVSVLPNGNPSPQSNSVGTPVGLGGEGRESMVAQGVSEDGSRIYWSRSALGQEPGLLYVRIDGKKTIQVSPEAVEFWTAAADGSKAIYSVAAGASPFYRNLYEFDFATKASTLIAKASQGVVGASKDASRVYFVSEDALGGIGEAGQPNLYLREGGSTILVATLSDRDNGIGPHSPVTNVGTPNVRAARVTPDGSVLAFVSTGSLTGYDNKDAVGGQPAVEVYRYDAVAESLACVSCNPSGSRPLGKIEGAGTENPKTILTVAARIPGWESQLFPSRALTENGQRLFFESFDALLPRDINGQGDVYEWQLASSQEQCEREGADLFVSGAGGCLSMISSGQSLTDSEFAEASPDGSDVFIRTASSLLPQDPGQVDIYDARVNGGFPPPPAPRSACEGEACQPGLPGPADPSPASSIPQRAKKKPLRPRCKRGKVRRGGHCVAKKHKKRSSKANHNGGVTR